MDKIWDWANSKNELWLRPTTSLPYLSERWQSENYKNVADVGSGFGYNALYLSKKGFKVTAIDISDYATKHTEKLSKENKSNVSVIQGDFVNLPFEDNSFDSIFVNNMIFNHTTEEVKKILDSIYLRLKKGGELYITLASKSTFDYVNSKDEDKIDDYTITKKDENTNETKVEFYVNIKDIELLFRDYEFIDAPIEQNVYDLQDTRFYTKRYSLLLRK